MNFVGILQNAELARPPSGGGPPRGLLPFVSYVIYIFGDLSRSRVRRPFRSWLGDLDTVTRARIQARILRFELGNLGDHKDVGGGVWEARFDFGPGYRVYFGKRDRELILLLTGDDKKSQRTDIKRAKELWKDFLKESSRG
jgi:putative addiction module killer protein